MKSAQKKHLVETEADYLKVMAEEKAKFAKKHGMTPAEFYAKHRIKSSGKRQEGL